MDTLIVGALLGFVISLITTWITARVNKSTDTRTQLLIKIDDWVEELTQLCNSIYFKAQVEHRVSNEYFENVSKLRTGRWFGVANGLKNKKLKDKIASLNQSIITP